MEKTPDIVDIIRNAFDQEKSLYENAADLGAILFELEREKKYYGENTDRMEELRKLEEIQAKVANMALDRTIEKANRPKKPHLTVVT